MSIQYKFFSIPINYASEAEAELNDFLRTVRVVTVHRELINQDNSHYWAVAVEYSPGERKTVPKSESSKKKTDYKEVLSPENFEIFAKLREWRKEAAAAEKVQLYTVFMNEHLATMVEKRVATKQGLREIDGIGDVRVEKYGDAVLKILKKEFARLDKNEKSQESLPFDAGS